jgi:hypothetical protein
MYGSLTGTFLSPHEVPDEFARLCRIYEWQFPGKYRSFTEKLLKQYLSGFSVVYCIYSELDLIGVGIGCQSSNCPECDIFNLDESARVLAWVGALQEYDSLALRHSIGQNVINKLVETGASEIYATAAQADITGQLAVLRQLGFSCNRTRWDGQKGGRLNLLLKYDAPRAPREEAPAEEEAIPEGLMPVNRVIAQVFVP